MGYNTASGNGYRVNLAELDNITARLQGLIGFVEQCLTQIESRVAVVQSTWSGEAADAHAAAHRDWLAGAQDMRDGLERMRTAARIAHDNYASASATNVAMLGRGTGEAR